ncbi:MULTISPECIES: helix-turn-helix domain-containing protein [unclassified Microcoleus]|nr:MULTISPECIES: helix-turn-helix domain-containing protein [unclassified Microcoleus]
MNYQYRVYPSQPQELRMGSWLEICRGVYNPHSAPPTGTYTA